MEKKEIFICGIDLSGKTTCVNFIKNSDYVYKDLFRDRNEYVDNMTSKTIIDKYDENVIVLISDIDILLERGKNRVSDDSIGIYETKRSLKYYMEKYIDIAHYNGYPIIDTSNKCVEETVKEILSNIDNEGNVIKKIKICDMKQSDIINNTKFTKIIEGESKKIYKYDNEYYKNNIFVILKNTIYSHSKQASGVIEGLSEIRARGTRFFLEMMRRNNLDHTYLTINNNGIILARFIEKVYPIEVVVKKYCEGTDKHSYYKFRERYTKDGLYVNGPYVRFDWRNPNHVDSEGNDLKELDGYYDNELYKTVKGVPMGDKTINERLISNIVDINQYQENALKMFYTIQYYFRKCDLIIKDICFIMHDKYILSEINQDCMRISTMTDKSVTYDKDIWRIGGSSSEDQILKKWNIFNDIMSEYFEKNVYDPYKYYEYDYIYEMKLEYNDNFSHANVYTNLVNRNNKRFLLLVNNNDMFSSFCSDIIFKKFDKNMTKKYYSHVFIDEETEYIREPLENSARRIIVDKIYDDIPKNRQIYYYKDKNYMLKNLSKFDTILFDEFDNLELIIYLKFMDKKVLIIANDMESIYKIWSIECIPVIPDEIFDIKLYESMFVELDIFIIFQDVSGKIKETKSIKKSEFVDYFNLYCPIKVIVNHELNNSVIFVVDKHNKKHFSNQSIIKTSLLNIKKHALSSDSALLYLFQNIWKIDDDPSTFLENFLSYINSKGIDLNDIQNELNSRRWNPYKNVLMSKRDKKLIGITSSKYQDRSYNYLLNNLGIEIIQNKLSRSLKIEYDIKDKMKYEKYFNDSIVFLPCKPKDIPWLMALGRIDGAITYNTIMDNVPKTYNKSYLEIAEGLSLCLIKKQNKIIDVNNKLKVITEHYRFINLFMKDFSDKYDIDIVTGSSESYLVNSDYDLCDAIVESGLTIKENNLEIYERLDIDINIGLYLL